MSAFLSRCKRQCGIKHRSPKQPDSVKRGNWIQSMPGKGWFTILRLYSPLEPFFTKDWRPSEIELVQ